MSKPPAIVFDLDGTLVDTAPDLLAALNAALGEAGVPPVDMGKLRNLIGQGARRMIERGLHEHGMPSSEKDMDGLLEIFLDHYRDHVADTSQPFPGAVDALDTLAGQGIALGVCTNKFEALAVQLIGDLKLDHYFGFIAGADTFAQRKPDGRHILNTLDRMGAASDGAIMVGDSETDVLAARAAGVPVIGVTFGYTAQPIHTYSPDAVISHFDQLGEAIAQIAGARV